MASASGHEGEPDVRKDLQVSSSDSETDSSLSSVSDSESSKPTKKPKEGPFKCTECGKTLKYKKNFDRHILESCRGAKKPKAPKTKKSETKVQKHKSKKSRHDTDVEPSDSGAKKSPTLVLTPVETLPPISLSSAKSNTATCAKISALPPLVLPVQEPISETTSEPTPSVSGISSKTLKQKLHEAVLAGPKPVLDPTARKPGRQTPPYTPKVKPPKSVASSDPTLYSPAVSSVSHTSPTENDIFLSDADKVALVVRSNPGLSPAELTSQVLQNLSITRAAAELMVQSTLASFSLLQREVTQVGRTSQTSDTFKQVMGQRCRQWTDYSPV
jgi:hypothetical protein